MKNENNDDFLIERYFNKELQESERQAFRERLKTDTAFQQAYTLRKSMAIFLKKEAYLPVFQTQLEQFGNEFFIEKKEQQEAKIVPIYRKPFWISLAAVAASIALVLLLWSPFSSKDLYQQHAHHQSLALVEKSDESNTAAQAETYFNENNYESAYQYLNNYIQTHPNHQRAQLALGISALEIGKTAEAINIFTTIHEGTTLLKNSGTWYLALTYLKQQDFETCKQWLQQIPNSDTILYPKAQNLMLQIP